MSSETNNTNKHAFSSKILPGSVAEQKEAERMAEFGRKKALENAEKERDQPLLAAKREQEHQRKLEENRKLMTRQRNARNQYTPFQFS